MTPDRTALKDSRRHDQDKLVLPLLDLLFRCNSQRNYRTRQVILRYRKYPLTSTSITLCNHIVSVGVLICADLKIRHGLSQWF